MQPAYEYSYSSRRISRPKLIRAILLQYDNCDVEKMSNYDQLLLVLDEHCQDGRCDRDVAKEIYEQSIDVQHRSSLRRLVTTYVQNLEMSKMCLLRDEKRLQTLQTRARQTVGRTKSYVYLKMIQASVYSRFSRSPTFEYRIVPSAIPPIQVVNSLNPVLDQQFTLELEGDEFSIVFYESGISVYSWTFPDKQGLPEGEYARAIQTENVSFEVMLKYLPRNGNEQLQQLRSQITCQKDQLERERIAFHKLCSFQPFVAADRRLRQVDLQRSSLWQFTQSLSQSLPFLRQHVYLLFVMLTLLLLAEALASTCLPMEFLDMVVVIYAIGLLIDSHIINLGKRVIVLQLTLVLLCCKSVFGAVLESSYTQGSNNSDNNSGNNSNSSNSYSNAQCTHDLFLIILVVTLKLLTIFLLLFSSIRQDEINKQRLQCFYSQKKDNDDRTDDLGLQSTDIWEDNTQH